MKKIDILNNIAEKIKDSSDSIVERRIDSVLYSGDTTTITLKSDLNNTDVSKVFKAGDEIFIEDGTNTSIFVNVYSIPDKTKITVRKNLTGYLPGGTIKKYELNTFLNSAINTYSRFRPLSKSASLTISGSTAALPEDWEEYFSEVKTIYKTTGVLNPIDKNSYKVELNDSNSQALFFRNLTSGTGRIIYSVIHKFNSSGDNSVNPIITIPDSDLECIGDIAASYFFLSKAAYYGDSLRSTDNSINVDYQNKLDKFVKLSNEFLIKAGGWLGVNIEQLKKGAAISKGASLNQKMNSGFDEPKRISIFHN